VYKYIEAASRLLGTGDTVHGVSHGAGTQQDTVVEQAGRKYTRGKLQRSEERSAQLISSKGPLLPCCIADSSVYMGKEELFGATDRTRGTRWMQH